MIIAATSKADTSSTVQFAAPVQNSLEESEAQLLERLLNTRRIDSRTNEEIKAEEKLTPLLGDSLLSRTFRQVNPHFVLVFIHGNFLFSKHVSSQL